MGLFSNTMNKLFGTHSQREVKSITPIVDRIEALGDTYKAMSEAELKSQTDVLKGRLQKGESLDDILPDAFAVIREAADRVLGMRPYRVQLIGGIILHQGRIAEMKPVKVKRWWKFSPHTSMPSPETAFTLSPSTTTWPSVTPSGWARSSTTWVCPWA